MLDLMNRSFNRRISVYPYTHIPSRSEPLVPPAIRRHLTSSRHGYIPIGASCVVLLAVLFSLLFISTIALAYIGADNNTYFQIVLNDISQNSFGSGIVLLGESIDIDVEEPAVTIRWSIVACGADLVLNNSRDIHGSNGCGIPAVPLKVYVDSSDEHNAEFDPKAVPIDASTGRPTDVQRLVRFDSDHILDVHNARFYPFDTYTLTSTLRVISDPGDGKSETVLPIVRLPVIQSTSSFIIISTDTPTFMNSEGDGEELSRDIELRIKRPGDARFYAMFLFGLNWALAHLTFGFVVLALSQGDIASTPHDGPKTSHRSGSKNALKQLAGILAIMLVIPQLRAAMPDAPGFDGVIIDSIGYFPQMILCALSAVALALILVKRELEQNDCRDQFVESHFIASRPESQTLGIAGSCGEKAINHATLDLLPLPRKHTSLSRRHYRTVGHTSEELGKLVSSATDLSEKAVRNEPGFNYIQEDGSHNIGELSGLSPNNRHGSRVQSRSKSPTRHPRQDRSIADELIESVERWNPFSHKKRLPSRDKGRDKEELMMNSVWEEGADYSTGVDSYPSRTPRLSFLRSRKPSLTQNSVRNRLTSTVIPEETLIEIFGERILSAGGPDRRSRTEEESPIRDIRALKWA